MYSELTDALTKQDRAYLASSDGKKNVDMTAVAQNWATLSISALNEKHEAAKQEAAAQLDTNSLTNAAEVCQLVIDLAAETPKFYYKYVHEAGTTVVESPKQDEREAKNAGKPTKMDAELGTLESQWKSTKQTAVDS